MITKKLISDLISKFKGIDLSKGHSYVTKETISDVHYTVPELVVFGKIQDGSEQHITSLIFNEYTRIIQTECSCEKKEMCMHAAALALYISRNFKDIEVSKEAMTSRFASSNASEWRTIEKAEDVSWKSLFEALLQKRRTPLQTVGYFLPNNHLEFHLWSEYSKSFRYVEMKRQQEDFSIICHKCTSSTNLLCEHQSEVVRFSLMNPSIKDWIAGNMTYSNEVQRISDAQSLDVETFKEHFKIRFDRDGVFIEPLTGNVFNPRNHAYFLGKCSFLDIEKEKEIIANTKDHSLFGQAMVWFFNDDLGTYTFLEGKLNKEKTELINSFKEIHYPDQFDEDVLRVVDRMNKLMFEKDAAKAVQFKELLELLKLNVSVINDVRHYVFTGKSFSEETAPFVDFNSVDRKITKKYLKSFNWSTDTCEHLVHIKNQNGLFIISMKIKVNDEYLSEEVLSSPFFTIVGKQAFLHDQVLPENHQTLKNYLNKLMVFEREFKELLPFLFELEGFYKVVWEDSAKMQSSELSNGQFQLFLEEHGEFITMEPRIQYEEESFNLIKEKSKYSKGQIFTANSQDVDAFKSCLAALHVKLDTEKANYGVFVLSYSDLLTGMWFLDFFDACKSQNIEVLGEENLTKLHFNNSIPSISSHIKSNQDWFDVEVEIEFGDQKVSMREWIDAIRNKSRFIKLHDGSLGVISESWYKKLREIYEMSDHSKGELKVNQFKFDEIREVFAPEEIDGGELFEKLKEKKERLESFEKEKTYPVPSILNAELRQYQWVGYQWLRFLDDFQMGGILADEMGLGKTLQIITLLAYFKESEIEQPSLIIVPRSLLFNWVDEIKKFCPVLNAKIHHGINRVVDIEDFMKFDVIITTYDTAVQDQVKLCDIDFHYIVLDESQAIKNPLTKRFQAVTKLKAENRLAMTGTPIENNTFDLYAQFSFVNPGIFGSANHFKNNFSRPIDVLEDERVSKKLQRIISPYILRRTKRQVAEDLPPKTESVIYCELKPSQREMYEALKNKIREDILVSLADKKSNNKTSFLAVEGLLRLRQICNSPYLVDKNLPPSKRESSKLNKLIDSLQHDLDGSSALVFSQFTSMLALIRERLDELNIKYAYLDGSTKDRRSVVEQFQNDDSCKIFLISLKAGNMGLNLTKAEYVFIVDPWWNPAVEAQAIDRTHRIGQDKSIIAYRMICEDTIEEKIINLQKKKKKLASDLIHSEEELFKSLKKEDLLGLFDL